MNAGYAPFPSQVMPELPMGGKPNWPPPLDIAPLITATPDARHFSTARPVMPTLPSLGHVPRPAAFPSFTLPQFPQSSSEPFAQPVISAPAFHDAALAATEDITPSAPPSAPAETVLAQTPAESFAAYPPFTVTPIRRVNAEAAEPALQPLEREEARVDFTDHELLHTFQPLVIEAVNRSLFEPGGGLDTYLEPMLRATIRRALAEHSPTQAPFLEPGFIDRTVWRLRALFTSRTYEQVFFEKTKRFRVEEVYLLEKINLSLISYASSDPARHASAKRVHSTARRIADAALDKEGTIRLLFDLPEGRNAVVREGKESLLIAVILGIPNDNLRIDLDYTLRRVEERFGARFQDVEAPLLLSIQPHLEDCLLIVAPAGQP